MPTAHSELDAAEIARARALLTPIKPADRVWPVLVAAACLALSAIAFATAMVLAPPLVLQPVARAAS